MKDNKDTKVVNLEEKKIYTYEDKIITKDRLLAALIGLLVGIALTSIAYSVCIKIQHPGFNNSGEVRKQERRKEAIIRKYKKKANKEAQTPSTETDENSQTEKSNESNN